VESRKLADYICRQDDLSSFCARASTSKVLAIDTEFLRERTYYPKLCLIQLATADEAVAVDPLLLKDLTALKELLVDESITKVFHACSQDLEVIYDALGCVPKPLFDTQVAAAFLGMRQQIGYGALVEEFCGVHLPKAEALSDWSRRPLDAEQLAYAADDVRYLPGIYDQMISRLITDDRLGWALPEMSALSAKGVSSRDPREAFIHLKKVSSLTRRQLAVAREACAWREMVAARRDVPRKWVVSDEVVIECCRHVPRDVDHLRRIRGTEQLAGPDAAALLVALRRGLATKPADYPHSKRHERPSTETECVLDLMYAMVRIVSEQTGIAVQLLATRDDLLDFLQGRTPNSLSQGWRSELLGSRLRRLLSGECGLTVKDGRVEVL
jgi:ribonuclease D